MLLFSSKAVLMLSRWKPRDATYRLWHFVYFLDFEMYSASRGPPCDSAAYRL